MTDTTAGEGVTLLPCPFCGGGAWLNDYEAKHSDLPPRSRAPQCRSCGASPGYLPTAKKAIKAWNTRATPAQPDTGDVAALREALEWLEWARPKAVSAMEDHRCLRVKSGHDMKGTYRSGTTYVGLYQSEVDEIEESADFIVNLRNRLAALSKPNAQGAPEDGGA